MPRPAPLVALLLALAATPPALLATTFNSPGVDDGVVDVDGGEWDADELWLDDPVGDSAWGAFNDLHGLWVTWDADSLYVAVQGAIYDNAGNQVGANSVNLYLDVDFGAGTGISQMQDIDGNALGAVSRNLERTLEVQGGFGADWGFTLWAGQFDQGFLDITDPAAPVNHFSDISVGVDLAQHRGYELGIPWSLLFPDAAGTVPPGTRLGMVVAIVGGGDSLSPESMPDGAGSRVIPAPTTLTVDGDGDGQPDVGWPPAGRISGTVTLSNPTDSLTVVDVVALRDGREVARASAPAGGGPYALTRLGAASYQVTVSSNSYIADPVDVDLGEGEERDGVDFLAQEVNGGLELTLDLVDGPELQERTRDWLVLLAPGGSDLFSPLARVGPGDPLDLLLRPIPDGDYRLQILSAWPGEESPSNTGYKALDLEVSVTGDSINELGTLPLATIRATRLQWRDPLDPTAGPIRSASTTVSLPGADFYARRALAVTLVDNDGDEAILDAASKGLVSLAATRMDPAFPPEGQVQFWSWADTQLVAQPLLGPAAWGPDAQGRPSATARFFATDDAQEVVRLAASHPDLAGAVLELGIEPRQPSRIELATGTVTVTAGDELPLQLQLKDVGGNDTRLADVQVEFQVSPPSGGQATVVPGTVFTDSEGSAGRDGGVVFRSALADTFTVQAFAEVGSGEIQSGPLELVVVPAPADQLLLSGRLAGEGLVEATVRLADAFGNVVEGQPGQASLTAGPPELVGSAPGSVAMGASGVATYEVALPAGRTGVLQLSATRTGLPNPTATAQVEVRPGLAASDEAAPETDDDHNADPGIDLTTAYAVSVRDTLVVTVPFASDFDGAHMMLLLEHAKDAEGIARDFFEFPVSFAHPRRPDLLFSYKYAADDYADLRRSDGAGGFQWYDTIGGSWVGSFTDGNNARANGWVGKSQGEVEFRIPLDEAIFGPGFGAGDSLSVQVYVTQETDGQKRPALDSTPHDATADMVPPTGNWWEQLPAEVELGQYGTVVLQELNRGLSFTRAEFLPPTVAPGDSSLLVASVDPGPAAPVPAQLQVFADLRPLGGGSLVPLRDDGQGGDAVAGDGLWSRRWVVSSSRFPGSYAIPLRALELGSQQQATGTATLTVEGEPALEPLLSATDPVGDDHGPNQPGRQFLYYEYPGSGVFFDGVFDLTGLEVLDAGDRLIFRVSLADLTNPAEPGAADWNAPHPREETCTGEDRVDLNLQNIVVLIDSERGGSTNVAQNRYVDIARQDAWEYALVADGWWKGLVLSNGSSLEGAWTELDGDDAMYFCNDARANTVDFFVSKSRLGLDGLAEAQLRERVGGWDLITMIGGHDGDSSADNWGGVRWVNEGQGAEWQFNGGRAGEDFRERDPNVIDILTVAGQGKRPGRSQEELMDFLTPEAQARFSAGENAVVLEAEELFDTAPPQVQALNVPGRAVVPWTILRGGPVVVRATITDESGVEEATMHWRGLGQGREANRAVTMGLLRSDLEEGDEWVADIPWSEVEAGTNVVPVEAGDGGTRDVRYVVLSFDATDLFGNRPDSSSVREYVLEVPVEPVVEVRLADLANVQAGSASPLPVLLPEGSRVRIPTAVIRSLAPAGGGRTLDLVYRALGRDQLQLEPSGGGNPSLLQANNRWLGLARDLRFELVGDSDTTAVHLLPEPVELSLHFPRYLLAAEAPEDVQFFRWQEGPRRWVKVGGHAELQGATVTVLVREAGTYGVFTTSPEIDREALVTGLQLSPNPFSPNGDGLYDLLEISYVLPEETQWAQVEVFDLGGERLRTLRYFAPDGATNRTLGLQWDGRDEEGRTVPMGIYVLRVEVQGRSGRTERATEAVAVVR